jgi:hypothetical protein
MKISTLIRSKFRVKIKSLAEEARIIRREESRQRTNADRGVLHQHRVGIVRREARASLLAYAFSRGVPYSVLECRHSSEIDAKRIAEIVKSLTFVSHPEKDINDWVQGPESKAA